MSSVFIEILRATVFAFVIICRGAASAHRRQHERDTSGGERGREKINWYKNRHFSPSLSRLSVSLSWLSFPSPPLSSSFCRFLTVLRRTCGRLA